MRRGLRRQSRGFTLIELVVVMIIVAILFLAVRPQFGRAVEANRERAALRLVIAVLTSAHAKAVSEGRLVRVVIAPQDAAVWAEIQSDPQTDRTQFDLLPVLGKRRLLWPDALALSAVNVGGVEDRHMGEEVIYFYPDGRTSGASFAFQGGTGQSFIVDLSPATGRVQVNA